MAKYTGKAMVIQWICPLGTVTFTGASDLLSLETKRSLDILKVTSGNMQDDQKLDNTKDVTSTLKAYMNTTQSANSGTLMGAAFDVGTYGTLQWGDQGTAVGKPKFGYAGFVKEFSMPLNTQKTTEIEVQIDRDGSWLFNWGSTW